jgi:hypothetical protein
MNDKDKESFEKWRLEYISTNKGYFKMIGTDDLAQVAWQAACEYKQAELAESTRKLLIFSDDLDQAGNELFMQEGKIKELQAENKKLREGCCCSAEEQYTCVKCKWENK